MRPSGYNLQMDKLPNNIRHYRELKGLSQEKLGSMLNKKKDTISKWERGVRGIDIIEAKHIAAKLGVGIDDLVNHSPAKLYKVDEKLMEDSARSIQEAAQSAGKKLSFAEAMAFTVGLYNHVMQYRQRGDNTEPNEAMACLILQQKVS